MNPRPVLDFSDKTVLVVGGSSGIGNGIARSFLEHGARVHVWGSRADRSDYDGVSQSDLSGLGYRGVDLSDPDAIDTAESPSEDLDILVLCQGTVRYKRAEFERAGWDHVMAVNLDSVMTCAMKFKPMLSRAKGKMIVVSSVAGFRATRGNPAYAASKAGAVHLTRTLADSWGGEGIRVNGIAPGLVDTKLTKVTTENPERLAATLATIPLGRLGEPEDMAKVALFLASDMSSYVTGQTIIVDGGMSNA